MQEQYIKEKVKERYDKIALTGNSGCCCTPGECCGDSSHNSSTLQSTKLIDYDAQDIDSIPKASILGIGCEVPTKFADNREGKVVVDLGSGEGIDVFLSANKVGNSEKYWY